MLLLLACHTDPKLVPPTPGTTTETTSTSTSTSTIPDGCRAAPPPADRERPVLYSLPYDDDANQVPTWGWRTLSVDGELSDEQGTLSVGRATYGRAVFSPDGSIVLAPLEDGRLGVITVVDGVPTAEPALEGDFYATWVSFDPSGEFAWILDGNWVENGGGVYRVDIDCDTGALSTPELVLPAKLPGALLPAGNGLHLLVAREAGGAPEDEINLVDLSTGTWIAGAPLFGDEEAIVSDATLAAGYVLVSDNAGFSSVPNRIAVASFGSDHISDLQVISPVDDPFSLWPSPDGARVLVASGYGNDLLWLSATNDNETPFGSNGAIDYDGGAPALPGTIIGVTRGSLKGLALVIENTGIRRVDLSGAEPVDLGLTSFGGGLSGIPGAIGVAP